MGAPAPQRPPAHVAALSAQGAPGFRTRLSLGGGAAAQFGVKVNVRATPVTAPRRKAPFKWAFPGLLALLALALVTAGLLANVNRGEDWSRFRQLGRSAPPASSITVALPNLIRPLTPEQA